MMLVEKLLLLQHGVVGVEGRPLLIVSNMTDESPRPLLQMLWRISLYVYEYDVDCIAIASFSRASTQRSKLYYYCKADSVTVANNNCFVCCSLCQCMESRVFRYHLSLFILFNHQCFC